MWTDHFVSIFALCSAKFASERRSRPPSLYSLKISHGGQASRQINTNWIVGKRTTELFRLNGLKPARATYSYQPTNDDRAEEASGHHMIGTGIACFHSPDGGRRSTEAQSPVSKIRPYSKLECVSDWERIAREIPKRSCSARKSCAPCYVDDCMAPRAF